MKHRSLKSLVYSAVCGLVLSGTPISAQDQPSREVGTTPRVVDVSLAGEGTLVGTVMTRSAQPIPGAAVRILHGDKVVATTVSDSSGQFSVQGLRNGTHAINCSGSQQTVRFWGTEAAPPSATSRLAVIVGDQGPTRGQNSGLGSTLVPLGIFGGVLAVTLATTLDNDDPASP